MQNELKFFAHDIRNVTSVIGLDADKLLELRDPTARRVGERIYRIAERLEAMCQTITQVPLTKAKPIKIVEHCDVGDIIQEVADLAPKSDWPVRVDVLTSPELITDRCASSLFRILHNIISNAVKAAGKHPGGKVLITARKTEADIEIHIIDNALGIPRRHRQQFDSIRRPTPAAGHYGLSAARMLAKKVGGSLHLQSTGPRGTHFRLTIPTAEGTRTSSGQCRVQIGPLSGRERALSTTEST